ncbi:unnamed protein product [Leptidea sinapis]|uniref:NADPH:adrenodoxin oxidoreductase, mitochondrial n=1 Tax=Leptidea sinapis TaxID=189913 RepID=A0A5E4Q427_9NEOP|nr:unnamed protein product [Leptidea sinapis]
MLKTNIFKRVVTFRCYTTSKWLPRVCVVGAGPAGFYAAMHLVKHLQSVQIDIIEKLPVPFGLVRYGVAPDHPEVKNVINQFSKLANNKSINFIGNIALGKDIDLITLRQHYDAVLLTYGAEEDRHLGIENECAANVIAARNFVGWYNGHPQHKDLEVDLSGETAAIIGQGNVALDIARILLSPIDLLKKTDITENSLQAISQSNIKELYLIGRRGPLQVAFTIKELREQLKLNGCRTIWRENDFIGIADIISSLPRPRKRLTELMLKSLNEQNENQQNMTHTKSFYPIFFRSPNKFLVNDNGHVSGIELTCNTLEGDKLENQKCVATSQKEILSCDLVFRSIGYKSVQADKTLKLNPNGSVINDNGRVLDDEDGDLGKLYVAGWLSTSPVGVIVNTMGNAFQVAKNICSDLQNSNCTQVKDGIQSMLKSSGKQFVDWQGWEKIDQYEVTQGAKQGKPREKVTSIKKMLEISAST